MQARRVIRWGLRRAGFILAARSRTSKAALERPPVFESTRFSAAEVTILAANLHRVTKLPGNSCSVSTATVVGCCKSTCYLSKLQAVLLLPLAGDVIADESSHENTKVESLACDLKLEIAGRVSRRRESQLIS